MPTIKEIENEFVRLGYKLTFDNIIVSRSGKVTRVKVIPVKDRIRFVADDTGVLLCSYPNVLESVRKFCNDYWYANITH